VSRTVRGGHGGETSPRAHVHFAPPFRPSPCAISLCPSAFSSIPPARLMRREHVGALSPCEKIPSLPREIGRSELRHEPNRRFPAHLAKIGIGIGPERGMSMSKCGAVGTWRRNPFVADLKEYVIGRAKSAKRRFLNDSPASLNIRKTSLATRDGYAGSSPRYYGSA